MPAIATVHGHFTYRVTRTLIVNPGDLSILQPRDGTALTLITCYPFSYVGDAPQRFVVQAARSDQETVTNGGVTAKSPSPLEIPRPAS